MAGAGYKLFNTGDVLTASDVNTYLQQQVVMVFASAAARTSALSGVLAEGMVTYLQDTNSVQVYNGTAFVAVGGSSPLTTKGDLYSFSTTDARLAVGANDTVLVADSSQATGLKWAAPASGSAFSGARAFKSTANQSITSGAGTNVTFQSESYDTANYHSNITNTDRFTVATAGYYLINCCIYWSTNSTGSRILMIRKNAGNTQMLKRYNGAFTNNDGRTESVTGILYLNANDFVVAEAYWDGTGTCSIFTDELNTYFEITYLGA